MPGFPDAASDAFWRRAAARLGVRLARTAYARNNQVSHDGRPPCATFATCTICPIGAQYSADWHVAKAEATGRCTVLADTPARRIARGAADGRWLVHGTRWTGGDVEVEAPRVVVAAHAMESARLLLLSGLGNPDHVGRHLMEHWEIHARGLAAERAWPYRVGYPILQVNQFYDGPDRAHRGAFKLVLRDQVDPLHDFTAGEGPWGRAMARHECHTFGRWRAIEVMTEHLPEPSSRVDLDPDRRDTLGDPVLRFAFVRSAADAATQRAGREAMLRLFAAAGVADVEEAQDLAPAAHHMGTCRMSRLADEGVVDANLQVHGADGLHVVGSAVFPTGGAVTPTLTIAALAMRLADHLAT
jgi:choline dehydrogenase-like flavoprotein